MLFQPTSGMPGQTSSSSVSPVVASPDSVSPEATARAVWTWFFGLIVAGLPVPGSVDVASGGRYAHVSVHSVDDVHRWAAAWGTPVKSHTYETREASPHRLTSTETQTTVGSTTVYVSHASSDPLPAADAAADGVVPGASECGSGVAS